MAIQDAIFRRSELLLGNESMERIAQKRVIIFGVGGVGSWCAESLVFMVRRESGTQWYPTTNDCGQRPRLHHQYQPPTDGNYKNRRSGKG